MLFSDNLHSDTELGVKFQFLPIPIYIPMLIPIPIPIRKSIKSLSKKENLTVYFLLIIYIPMRLNWVSNSNPILCDSNAQSLQNSPPIVQLIRWNATITNSIHSLRHQINFKIWISDFYRLGIITNTQYRGSPTYTKITNTVFTTTVFGLCTCKWRFQLGWFKNQVSSQTEKLMAATKFSDYLGLKHYKNAKK